MRVWNFEDDVWNTEGIRIVVRTSSDVEGERYNFTKAAPETWTVSELIEKRIDDQLDGEAVVAIRGDGTRAYGNTSLRKLRESYKSE